MAADPETEEWAHDVEGVLTQRFRQRAMHFAIPDLPQAWDILGWWEVMQHHGAPTGTSWPNPDQEPSAELKITALVP
jgi:hypothetical protein